MADVSNDPTQPSCSVRFTFVFNNTSETDMNIGIDAKAAGSYLLKAGGSRNLPGEIISLLPTRANPVGISIFITMANYSIITIPICVMFPAKTTTPPMVLSEKPGLA